MFAPLLALLLLGQGASIPSPFIGHWEGSITYTRPDNPWSVEIEIVDLVIDADLTVSGRFGKPAAKEAKTKLGGDGAKISPEGEFSRILLWVDRYPAFCHFRGTVELSKDSQTMIGKKFIVRDFGQSNSGLDDEDCPAKLELHRKTIKGAIAPSFLQSNLKDCPSGSTLQIEDSPLSVGCRYRLL